MIERRLRANPGSRLAFRYLDEKGEEHGLSYGDLRIDALRIATGLQGRIEPAEPVLLVLPTGLDFVRAFLGCLLAGCLPVPLPAPRGARNRVSLERIAGAAQRAAARFAIVEPRVDGILRSVCQQLVSLGIEGLRSARETDWRRPAPLPADPAYLQFTSGSCGHPRGVVISHRATLANLATIRRVFGHDRSSSALTWLPLHHDMGLVGHVLQPLYFDGTSILMSPTGFSRDPLSWLRAISRYRVTSSGAPAFAYLICAAALEAGDPGPGLDLSHWRNAYIGADRVPPEVLDRFAKAAAPFGFDSGAWLPCYGLAEAVLFVAGDHRCDERLVDAARLSRGWAVDATPGARARRLLGYRVDRRDFDARIVSPETGAQCRDGEVGELWLSGLAVCAAYHRDAASSREVFGAHLGDDHATAYLRTGDLGFAIDGQVYLTGRLKDLIIVHGLNHFPEDIERTVLAADPDPEWRRVACFAIPGEATDGLVVLRETGRRRRPLGRYQERLEAIIARIGQDHAIGPRTVMLVPPGSIALTSSGKVARSACRRAYLSGELTPLASSSPADPLPALDQAPAPTGSPTGSGEEPAGEVAIIGMACRFPGGADDLDAFWSCLREGKDCISQIPPDRWDAERYYDPRPAVPGKMNTRWGGFVRDVDLFDPHFFGITGHEAAEMDPQQRLLLEVAWRALEDAGIPEEQLRGSDTGVFVGISNGDYLRLKLRSSPDFESFNAYSGLGNAYSIAANRLSYVFDLQGPSVALDTACSSSLTAIHLAAESIRNGECEMAIAGGVNLLLSPDATILLSQFGMMAADGRCKAFDARADGYVRSEGCGLVVLRNGRIARDARDPVRAWILGSALAQDGRSAGITAPNPKAQRHLLRRALARARVAPEDITYVEAHGTGTAIGDPAEMAELKTIYGNAATEEPCTVGSVKANMGHLEAAAGVAGLIKVVLAIEHGEIPRQIHFQQLNSGIELAGTRLRIPEATTTWASAGPRRAALSSFGFGGALVHMVVEQARLRQPSPPAASRGNHQRLLILSAKTRQAMTQTTAAWVELFATQRIESLRALCHAAACRRSHFRYRIAVVDSAQSGLRQRLVDAQPIDTARQTSAGAKVAFMFTGQGGGRFVGMGRHLYNDHRVFRQAFDRCAAALDAVGAPGLASITFGEDGSPAAIERLDQHAQPSLFAVEYALAQLWLSWGVRPAALLGHSIGEITAACLAGCMEPEDAMPLVALRGRLMQGAPGNGGMLGVGAGARDIEAAVDLATLGLSIAAINAPDLAVISGDLSALRQAADSLAAAGLRTWHVDVMHAFHSAMMDGVLDAFEAAAARIEFRPPVMPLWSSLTGEQLTRAPTARDWRDHLRHCVRFRDSVDGVVADGARVFVEIGPGHALSAMVQRCHPDLDALYCPSIEADQPGTATILRSLGQLYTNGFDLDWEAVYDAPAGLPWRLPTHPFHHQRYWYDEEPPAEPLAEGAADSRTGAAVFDLVWRSRPLPASSAVETAARASWILVGDGKGLSNAIARRLEATGQPVFLLRRSGRSTLARGLAVLAGARARRDIATPSDCDSDGYAARLNHVVNRLSRYDASRWRVIYVGGMDASGEAATTSESLLRDQASVGVAGLVALIQGIKGIALHLPLWVVTENAEPVRTEAGLLSEQLNLAQSPLWGLARTAFLEHPDLRGGLIDLQGGDDPMRQAGLVIAQVESGTDEAQVAFRGGKRFVEQLAEAPLAADLPGLALDPERSYLVTGGMGGIGLECARWLAARGARRIVLVGRNALPPRAEWAHQQGSRWHRVAEVAEEIECLGASVETVACDVRDHAGIEQLLASERARAGLGGVLHLAGVNWFRKVQDLGRDELLDALAINVSAAWNLHRLTLDDDLDLFVLFSSVSALWGSVDLAHYTAANHFLDVLCRLRRRSGRRALSIDWGPWARVGMSAHAREEALLDMLGLNLIAPDRALAIMEQLIVADRDQSMVADIRWERFQSFVEFSLSPSLFEEVSASSASATSATAGSLKEISRLEPQTAREQLVEILRTQLSKVMHTTPGTRLDADTRFNFMGMDSLTAMAYCARLEVELGAEVPPMTVYNYPTLNKMAGYLYDRERSALPPSDPAPPSTTGLFAMDPAPEASLRLFCFPYAGAGPAAFCDWHDALSGSVIVVPLELPGHAGRLSETPITSMQTLVDFVAEEIAPYTGGPFGFFGHSFGALLCFEVAQALARRGLPLPQPLILSGCAPPQTGRPDDLHGLDDDRFLDELRRRFGIVPEDGLDDPLRQALLPALRADIMLAETAMPPSSPPLDCVLHVFGGRDDKRAPPEVLSQWSLATTTEPRILLFAGGHMFITGPARSNVIAAVKEAIDQRLEKDSVK